MEKLKAFIIDDNNVHAEILWKDLREQPEFSDVHIYHSCAHATIPILEFQPNVIFLDVEMPGMSGLDFWNTIRDKTQFPIKVVFYSAYSEYILNALRLSAYDFLLKPYKHSELRTVIDHLMEEQTAPIQETVKEILPVERRIGVQTVNKLLLLTIDDVLWMNYNRIERAWLMTLTDRSVHRLHQVTKAGDLVTLHPSLVRVNQGDVLNISYLAGIENSTKRCLLCPPFDDIEIYASRRNFPKLKEMYDII